MNEQGELVKNEIRVLIVEDESQLINVMRMHLVRLRKYSPENIFAANDGQEALIKLEELILGEKIPHIIYTDLRMPKLDGANFFLEINARFHNELKKTIKFILTGISLSEEKAELERTLDGIDVEIIYKPFKYAELIALAENKLLKRLQ